jgi:hypothetical protein
MRILARKLIASRLLIRTAGEAPAPLGISTSG